MTKKLPLSLVLGFVGLSAVSAHPLCGLNLDGFQSPRPNPNLSFCTMYQDSTCLFSSAEDEAIESAFDEAVSLPPKCRDYHKQFLCATGDPFQAHLFNLESSEPDRMEPFLCEEFCNEYEINCGDELTIDCSTLVGPAPYCLPVVLPNPGTGGLEEIVTIPEAALIDYADPGPSMSGEHVDYWASFDGMVYERNKDTGVVEELFNVDVFQQGELGFLTMELDPDFMTDGAEGENMFWVFYSVQENLGSGGNSRFNILGRRKLDSSGHIVESCEILRLRQNGWNHNGADIEFQNGALFLSIGDDAPQNGNGNAQDLTNLYGTVIRITPKKSACDSEYFDPDEEANLKQTITNNYDIPGDNPFFNNMDVRGEIYAYGFRNPWRTFQDEDGNIYIGDVGQQRFEELSLLVEGKDYGWEITEGFSCFVNDVDICEDKKNSESYEPPLYDYAHFEADRPLAEEILGFSITIGHIYTGSIRASDLSGKVLFADYVTQQIWAILPTAARPWTGAELVVPNAGGVVSMRKDSTGETVVLTLGEIGYVLKPTDEPASTPQNGVCEEGENCKDDPFDCPGQLKGSQAEKWCCANGVCDEGDCGPVQCDATIVEPGCGNNFCDSGEDCTSCPFDCKGHIDKGQNQGGKKDFCCEGRDNFEVICVGPGCSEDPDIICSSNKKGNKKNEFFDY